MLNKKIKSCLVVALIATLLSQYSGSSIYAISDSVSEDMLYSVSSDLLSSESLSSSNLNFNKISKNYIEYVSYENGEKFLYKENIVDKNIYSSVYKINEDGSQSFYKKITSNISPSGFIESKQEFSDGSIEKSTLKASFLEENYKEELNDSYSIQPLAKKTYIRTDRRGISLVGKKITIAIAAAAIAAACPGMGIPIAVAMIRTAMAITGTAVSQLPNYLFETRRVYRITGGPRIYTRFEGNFYLDASRTQYIGSATYSQRGFH